MAESDAQALKDTLDALPNDPDVWHAVERTAFTIADALRSADAQDDLRTSLGRTSLITTLAALVPLAAPDIHLPESPALSALYQLMRVSANICAYHDENRTLLIKSGLLDSVVTTLKSFIPASQTGSLSGASVSQLQVMKTALGVLINASYAFKPAREHLVQSDVVTTVLQLYSTVYKPRGWKLVPPNSDQSEVTQWTLRQGFASWTWQLLAEFRDQEQESGGRLFSESHLPLLVDTVSHFLPSENGGGEVSPFDSQTTNQFYASDLESLEESSISIEALILDSEAARVQIASSDASLRLLVDFIEQATYPQEWVAAAASERAAWQKTFDVCKGALIRVLVHVAGEDRNLEVLWNGKETAPSEQASPIPNSWFALKMFDWIKDNTQIVVDQKNDARGLVVAATLCLGNLGRRDSRAIQLTRDPTNATPYILKLLDPGVDIKVKNGTLGFLKTLSQPQQNRQLLGDAGAIETLADSKVWERIYDMAEVVQASAIGATKHLCHGNVSNSVKATTPTAQSVSCLEQILQLVARSDTIAIKSEGTRVLGNVIRSLCTAPKSTHPTGYSTALAYVCKPDQCLLLSRLLSRSQKYTILLNEGIVSMTLVALQKDGDVGVLSALTTPLEDEFPSQGENSTKSQSSSSSPTDHPRTALDVVASIIASKGSKFPPELRTNACSLVVALFRDTKAPSETTARSRSIVKDALRSLLQDIASDDGSLSQGELALKEAAQRAVSLM